jgi:hypothetical protein
MTQHQVAQHPVKIGRVSAKSQGLTYYFTGVPCKYGHLSSRYTSDGTCAECVREKLRRRYANDPDKWRQKSRLRTLNRTDADRARTAAATRERRKNEPGRFRKYEAAKRQAMKNDPVRAEKERVRHLNKQKRAYAVDPEKYKKIASERHAQNREKNNLLAREWKKNNPEKVRALNQKWGSVSRANRMKRVPPWLTEDDFKKINSMYREAREKGLQVDHIIPLQGKTVSGLHVPSNLQLLTRSQNAAKKNRYEVQE